MFSYPHHRQSCPQCGARVRSLRLASAAVQHHQCTECGYRYENVQEAPDEDGELDGFACLDALPAEDRDAVEGLALLLLGTGTLIGALELTSRTLVDFLSEHGASQPTLRSFAYPAHKWLLKEVPRFASYFVVIDQGQWRVCFTVRRLRPRPLP
jgi:hypothetical protein